MLGNGEGGKQVGVDERGEIRKVPYGLTVHRPCPELP